MQTGSVKRPILVYALVLMMGLAVTVVSVASFALLDHAKRTAAQHTRVEVRRLAALGDPALIEAEVRRRTGAERTFWAFVSAERSDMALSLDQARACAAGRAEDLAFACARVEAAPTETYVVTILEPVSPRPVLRAVRRLLLVSLGAAVVFGLLLALLLGRLVLGPLATLGRVAETPDALTPDSETPNEIAEVALRFRRTVRALERDRLELERRHAELARMQETLIRESKLASVGRLAAGVAHEIGNPLAAVLGYLALLRSGLGEAETKDVLARSENQLRRIHATIKKLLTYARRDEEAEPISSVALLALVDDALLLAKNHPALAGVAIEWSGPPPEVAARGRPGQLGQVLMNLLVNAGQALAGAAAPKIRLGWLDAGPRWALVIDDNGPGIPVERREQVFDPFFTTKPPGEGTGLGLAISRSLVDGMGGRLYATDGELGGACLRLELEKAPTSG